MSKKTSLGLTRYVYITTGLKCTKGRHRFLVRAVNAHVGTDCDPRNVICERGNKLAIEAACPSVQDAAAFRSEAKEQALIARFTR